MELIITRVQNNKEEKASGGFAMLNLFENTGQLNPVYVSSGSPRMMNNMVNEVDSRNRVGRTILHFTFE